MKEEQHWWAPPLGTIIVLALLVSFALIASGRGDWFSAFLSNEGAGWAQAIGGVLAIVGAYRMGRAQIDADRALETSRRAHEDYRRLMVIDATLLRLELILSTVKGQIDSNEVPILITVNWHQEQIHDVARTIKGFNLFECPSAPLIFAISTIPDAVERFADHMGEYMKICDEGMEKDVLRALPSLWNGLHGSLGPVTSARAICREAMAALEAQR